MNEGSSVNHGSEYALSTDAPRPQIQQPASRTTPLSQHAKSATSVARAPDPTDSPVITCGSGGEGEARQIAARFRQTGDGATYDETESAIASHALEHLRPLAVRLVEGIDDEEDPSDQIEG